MQLGRTELSPDQYKVLASTIVSRQDMSLQSLRISTQLAEFVDQDVLGQVRQTINLSLDEDEVWTEAS